MSELKPCPFCGGRPLSLYDSDFGAIVECECGAVITDRFESIRTGKPWRTQAEAIEAWNQRVERTCRIVKTWSDSDYVDGWRYHCSVCWKFIPVYERGEETGDVIRSANYCPSCGARVISDEGQGHLVADAIRRLEEVVGE